MKKKSSTSKRCFLKKYIMTEKVVNFSCNTYILDGNLEDGCFWNVVGSRIVTTLLGRSVFQLGITFNENQNENENENERIQKSFNTTSIYKMDIRSKSESKSEREKLKTTDVPSALHFPRMCHNEFERTDCKW